MANNAVTEQNDQVQRFSLSHGQRALWYLYELDPSGCAYNLNYAWYIRSEFDVAVFLEVLEKMIERHPVWRSTYSLHQGEPVQEVHPSMPVFFEEIDASGWSDQQIGVRLRAEAHIPFDLRKVPPVRWKLFRREGKDPILYSLVHHLGTDLWAYISMLNEIGKIYTAISNGEEPELKELRFSNADYIAAQKKLIEGKKGQRLWKFWEKQLQGDLPALNMPTDRPRPPFPSFRGDFHEFHFSRDFSDKFQQLAEAHGVSAYVLYSSAFQVLLHRYTGQTDILVGTPTVGRRTKFGGLINYFVNPIVIRANLENNPTFKDFLQQIKQTVFLAMNNQDYPFPLIVGKMNRTPDPSRSPIFQVSFAWEEPNGFENKNNTLVSMGDNGNERYHMGLLDWERIPLKLQLDQFDLMMRLVELGDSLRGVLEFNTDLFDEGTIERLANNYTFLMQSILENPDARLSELALLTPQERQILLRDWNDTKDAYSNEHCAHHLFENQVAKQPEEMALLFEEEEISYAELNQRANKVAAHLKTLGIGPDKLVGISLERTPHVIVSVMSVLKAGGAYVPLDPNYPEERIEYILQEAKVSVVLTQEKLKNRFAHHDTQIVCLDSDWDRINTPGAENPTSKVNQNCLSHVIYTSGSTGKPKGVAIEHRCVAALINWVSTKFSDEEREGVLASTSLNFDLSVYEIVCTLALGGTIVLVENALYLPTAPSRDKVRTINTVPSAIKELIRMEGIPKSVITVNLAGEPLKNPVVQKLYQLDHIQKVYNLYGPSEDTTYSTWALMERGDDYVVMIGRPLTNTVAYVLDQNMQPVPLGVPGELWLGGDGLAREYLNRPDLTEERFLHNPFINNDHARIYKTGDLVRYRLDSQLECLGRIDHQVKIRGFRIELGEIEAVLQKHPSIHESIVVDITDKKDDKILVGYVTEKDGLETNNQEIREFLKELLPEYMVPALIMVLKAMPLNPNGKIDRKKLPEPQFEVTTSETAVKPQNEIEEAIAEIWKEVLHLDQVGVDDTFFDIGGHSLLLAQVRFRLEERFDQKIQTTDLFQYPTIRSLARFLSPEKTESAFLQDQSRYLNTNNTNTEVAVIGMAGRFPKAPNVEAFWQNLKDGVESIQFFSQHELEEEGVDRELLEDSNYVKAGCLLDDIDLFDASFFSITPREAESMDPQHRIFLEGSWEALENAGYDPDNYSGRIGVFAGVSLNTYYQNNIAHNERIKEAVGRYQIMINSDKDFVPTRVSYKLNLKGPSINVQTACSTSLVAIHMGCKSLINREADMVLAGGVCIIVPHKTGYMYEEGGILAPDGHCRAFDAKGRGMYPGNGMGIVVLKRLDDALKENDTIVAIVKGSAINNDGSLKIGYTAPSVEGQSGVIADAQAIAGVNPETITYVEAHGTGTALGDPIEIAALTQAFRTRTDKSGFCAIGSAKTNIGHLDAAAGVTGFIKAVLALNHKMIPPSLNYEEPNPSIDFENSPFFVNTKLTDWQSEGVRRAAVSAFGIGGTNAHAILEEAPDSEPEPESKPFQLLLLSTKTGSALEKASNNLVAHFKKKPDLNLANTAYTLKAGRRHFENRRMLVCSNIQDAIKALETQDPKRVITAFQDCKQRSLVFLFSGQGSQYVEMAKQLYETEAVFRQEVDRCSEFLKPHLGLNLTDLIYPTPANGKLLTDEERKAASRRINQTEIAQPALFVIEYSLAKLWRSWGLEPQAMMGHSIGEYAAACLAGVFALEDALALVAARGRLMQQQPSGDMMAVPLTEQEITPYLHEGACLAAINSPSRCVVAGPKLAMDELEDKLSAKEIQCTRLHTSHAFHSSMMDSMLPAFTAEVAKVTLHPPKIKYISNVTGTWITPEQATDPKYYALHLRNAVRFVSGLNTLFEQKDQIFLEIGPGKTLLTFTRQQLKKAPGSKVFSSIRHPKETVPDSAFLLNTLGQLWLFGSKIDWNGFYKGERRKRIPLPTYPFEKRRFWVDAEPKTMAKPTVTAMQGEVMINLQGLLNAANGKFEGKLIFGNEATSSTEIKEAGKSKGPPRKKENFDEWFYTPLWRQSLPPAVPISGNLKKKNWLVFVDDLGFGGRVAAHLKKEGQNVVVAKQGNDYAKLENNQYQIHPGSQENYRQLLQDVSGGAGTPNYVLHFWSITKNNKLARVDRIEACLESGFFSLLALVKAMDHLEMFDPIQVGVVSNGMQHVTHEALSCPEKATLLGPIRVIPREFPHISCRSIDIDLPEQDSALEDFLVDQIPAELTSNSPDMMIAYRTKQRWSLSYNSVTIDESRKAVDRLREKGCYLITGGLGGIGLALAGYLAKRVKAKLVLLRRSPFPMRKDWDSWLKNHDDQNKTARNIQRLQSLEAMGSEVMVASADVADQKQMAEVVAEAEKKFGTINGVVHAAGLYPSGMIGEITSEQAQRVMAPKVKGTAVLDALFTNHNLDFFALFSSTSAILGNQGFVDYVAANAYLDAYAQHASGNHNTVAMSWDGWREVGMAADLTVAPEHKDAHDRTLAQSMSTKEGLKAFSRILSQQVFSQVIVSPLDFEAVIHEVQSFLEANLEDVERSPSSDSLSKNEPGADKETKTPTGQLEETEAAIAELWKDTLGLDEVSSHDNFNDLGGDSLTATMLASKLRRIFKVKVPPKSLTADPTLSGWADVVDGLRGIRGAPKQVDKPDTPTPLPDPALEVESQPKVVKTKKRPNLKTPFEAPRSDLEKQLVEIYRVSLHLDSVGINDHFLELGGHSDLAASLANQINETCQVSLPSGIAISEPTVARVAERIEAIRWAVESLEGVSAEGDDDEEFEL